MTNTATTTPTSSTSAIAAPVTCFEVHTPDLERAKRFYSAVFGWTYDESMPDYPMVDAGEGGIGGGIRDTGGAYPAGAMFLVQVPDVAASLQAVADHGGSVIVDQQTTPVGLTYGYAANPDGSVFGIWCPPAG